MKAILAIAGTFAGMPAAFVFLAIAMYQNGSPIFWILGILSLLFGLCGLWQFFFGGRVRSGAGSPTPPESSRPERG